MKIVKAEATCVCFFSQEKYDLSEVISDKALIWVSTKTSERESDQFLKQKEVLLLVVIELMERIKLIWSIFKSDNEVICQ